VPAQRPTPFLTLEDPNAKIKGSRDPLAAQPIWAAFGRHVVTNLTTQSTSVRGFTTLLLGRYFAAELVDKGMANREDALDVFLRMEQISAYVRHVAHEVEGEIRGIERVRKTVDETRGRVPIHADRRGWILSDQKVYGLWGLYSVSARTSGLIPEGELDVTEETSAFLKRNYIDRLGSAERPLLRLLTKGGTLETRKKDHLFSALADMLKPTFNKDEVDFYGRLLRDGSEVSGGSPERQGRFRTLLERETDLDALVGRPELLGLVKASARVDEELAGRLDRIAHLEALLAPAESLFQHILARHGQSVEDVATVISGHWGPRVPNLDRNAFAGLMAEIRARSNTAVAKAMDACHEALATGDYASAIRSLLDWNQVVMETRGAAPWVRLGDRRRLDVRYRGVEPRLPDRDALQELWRNSYFIDALKLVTRQLRPTR
jgi:hypothetical protein